MTSYLPTTLVCKPRVYPAPGFENGPTGERYEPCPGLYRGVMDGGVIKIFFLRQGSPSTGESWSTSGPQTFNLNKQAMVDDAMGKVFEFKVANENLVLLPNTEGAPLYSYRIHNGVLYLNTRSQNESPLWVQDIAIELWKLKEEIYDGDLRGPREGDGIYEMPRYLYWRYQQGDPWTRIDTGVAFTPRTTHGPFLTDHGGSIQTSYNWTNFEFTNDSQNWPDGVRGIQLTAYDADLFTRLGDYVEETAPQSITLGRINDDGNWNTYQIDSIVDNGSYYTFTLDTDRDVPQDLVTRFEPDGRYTYRYKAYDGSQDPAGARAVPHGYYIVRDGRFCVSQFDRDEREWFSDWFGNYNHEAIWYWRYAETDTESATAWVRHDQTSYTQINTLYPTGTPFDNILIKGYTTGNVVYDIKGNSEIPSGPRYTYHFEATDQPQFFPDSVRDIELTSHPRINDRLFVIFDVAGVSKPRLVVETTKQEVFGSFYSKGTDAEPTQLKGVADEAGNITWIDQSPTREGQVITYITPTNRTTGAMFISIETSPGVYEWKARS